VDTLFFALAIVIMRAVAGSRMSKGMDSATTLRYAQNGKGFSLTKAAIFFSANKSGGEKSEKNEKNAEKFGNFPR